MISQLTTNLQLTSISENNTQEGKLLSVACYFTFFGEEGWVLVSTSKLDSHLPSYGMTEICTELSDSFNDILEDDDDVWQKIVVKVKEFIKEWESEQED